MPQKGGGKAARAAPPASASESGSSEEERDEGAAAATLPRQKYTRSPAQKERRKALNHLKAAKKRPFTGLAGWKPGDPLPPIDHGSLAVLMAQFAAGHGSVQGTTTQQGGATARTDEAMTDQMLALLIRHAVLIHTRATLPGITRETLTLIPDPREPQEHPQPHPLHPGAGRVGCMLPGQDGGGEEDGKVATFWSSPFW